MTAYGQFQICSKTDRHGRLPQAHQLRYERPNPEGTTRSSSPVRATYGCEESERKTGMNMTTAYEILQKQMRWYPAVWRVTGVSEFIGSNFLKTLIRLDHHVVVLGIFAAGYLRNLDEVQGLVGFLQWANFKFIEGDIRVLMGTAGSDRTWTTRCTRRRWETCRAVLTTPPHDSAVNI
jgi:hypothetical protein